MVSSRVVPAECIYQMDALILIIIYFPLMLQDMKDPANDLEELLLNALLSGGTTSFQTSKIVSRLHPVASK